jgi:hypothetical protein
MIGLFHPVVAKMEYHLGKKAGGCSSCRVSHAWPLLSFFLRLCQSCLAAWHFPLFWSTLEMFYQHERVLKGRAKKNPKRNYDA